MRLIRPAPQFTTPLLYYNTANHRMPTSITSYLPPGTAPPNEVTRSACDARPARARLLARRAQAIVDDVVKLRETMIIRPEWEMLKAAMDSHTARM